MRPLNHPSSPPAVSLEELATQLDAGRVAVLAAMPSGDLRLVRLSRDVRAGTALGGSATSLVRNYVADSQFHDPAAWAAALELPRDAAAPAADATPPWPGVDATRTIVAGLRGPLLAGFGGALVAIRGEDRAPFTDADRATLREAAVKLDADAVPRRLGGRSGEVGPRLYAMREDGTFVGAKPADSPELDPTLAGHLTTFARQRVADATPATGGERVLLPDASGEQRAFTLALHASHQSLAPDGGRVLLVAQVPHFAEWLEIRPEDVAADQEMGRLLPAFRFMHDHFHEGVTLPAIARHVSLSPFHFHRRFTELLGITPKHFLYDCQIARAEDYLLASTHELEEVAKLCGFAHQSHFTSRFKQATGLTPTRWRRLKHTNDRAANRPPSRV